MVNGLYDPPRQDVLFSGDPLPGYIYPVLFPDGDPTGTPLPPGGMPTLPKLPALPAPPALAGSSGLLIAGALGLGLLLLMRKK